MNTYTLYYKCSNCFSWVDLEIPKKIEAPNYIECWNYGMNTCYKSEKYPPDNKFPQCGLYDSKREIVKYKTQVKENEQIS